MGERIPGRWPFQDLSHKTLLLLKTEYKCKKIGFLEILQLNLP